MPTPEDILMMLRHGGRVVAACDLSPGEVAQARRCRRLLVNGRGFGFVYLPKAACRAMSERAVAGIYGDAKDMVSGRAG